MTEILFVSFLSGRPFIDDLSTELQQKKFSVWHLVLSEGKLKNYGESEIINLVDHQNIYLNGILSFVRSIKKVNPSFVHFHSTHFLYYFLTYFTSKNQSIYTTVWGTDFYKATGWKKMLASFFYTRTKKIIFTNPKTLVDFKKEMPSVENKAKVLRFGLTKLKLIESLRKQKFFSKIGEITFPKNKIIVCIGYNASKNQNHEKILDQLSLLPDESKRKLFLIIPMTYGGSENYINVISAIVNRLEIESFILRKFITDEEVCKLRLNTNIFIQLQSSDQFSGATQEALYAGSTIVTGSWLPYNLLIEKGIEMISVEKFTELPSTLEKIINGAIELNVQKNSTVINQLSGWETILDEHCELYQE